MPTWVKHYRAPERPGIESGHKLYRDAPESVILEITKSCNNDEACVTRAMSEMGRKLTAEGKVVGTCGGGTKKIVYSKAAAAPKAPEKTDPAKP